MEVLHPRCAGIDVSKRDAKVCVRIQGGGQGPTSSTLTTWGATTNQILALRDHLIDQRVEVVLIESTGTYWKPFYYLLEDAVQVQLVNAHESKTVPGRKTDASDAAWLAELGAHGLVRASFVPPPQIRELRDLTRTRSTLLRDRARELQRLEKDLEDTQVKLSSVVSDLNGVSARDILAAIVAGETNPEKLADLAQPRLKVSRANLVEALTGRVTAHHRYLIKFHLRQIDQHSAALADLNAHLEEVMAPFRAARELLVSIPGISTTSADVIIAETGADMTTYPTAEHLCSWAGLSPGLHQSAGRVKHVSTRPGNVHLQAALGTAALCAARSRKTFFSARYRRIAARRGKKKALVAVERSILTAVWHMLTTGAYYQDPGPDYYTRHTTHTRTSRAIRELQQLGYQITLAHAS
jgi:transposase